MWLTQYSWWKRNFWEMWALRALLFGSVCPCWGAHRAGWRTSFSSRSAMDISIVHTKHAGKKSFGPCCTKWDFKPWHKHFFSLFFSAYFYTNSLRLELRAQPWEAPRRWCTGPFLFHLFIYLFLHFRATEVLSVKDEKLQEPYTQLQVL